MSVFRRRKSSSKPRNGTESAPRLPTTLDKHSTFGGPRRVASGPASPASPASQPDPLAPHSPVHIDDFGRPVLQRPTFAAVRDEAREADGAAQADMQLLYGYGPIGTTVELGIVKVEKIAVACAEEIRSRGTLAHLSDCISRLSSNASIRRSRHAPRFVDDGARPDGRCRQLAMSSLYRRSGITGRFAPRRSGFHFGISQVGPRAARQRRRRTRIRHLECVQEFQDRRERCVFLVPSSARSTPLTRRPTRPQIPDSQRAHARHA